MFWHVKCQRMDAKQQKHALVHVFLGHPQQRNDVLSTRLMYMYMHMLMQVGKLV